MAHGPRVGGVAVWPKRPRRPRVATSTYSAYLRARVCALGIGEAGEPTLYSDDEVPLRLRVAFAVGLASKRRAPVLSESELARQVGELVDLSVLVAEVEADDPLPSSD